MGWESATPLLDGIPDGYPVRCHPARACYSLPKSRVDTRACLAEHIAEANVAEYGEYEELGRAGGRAGTCGSTESGGPSGLFDSLNAPGPFGLFGPSGTTGGNGLRRRTVRRARGYWVAVAVLLAAFLSLAATPVRAAGQGADAFSVAISPASSPSLADDSGGSEPCPLTSPEHNARLVAPAPASAGTGGDAGAPVFARVGAPLPVVVALQGPPLPSGVFPVVNIDMARGPEGGRVSAVTGYPESEVRFSAPGRYELDLTVTLVARSSCGGAKARTVMERRMAVQVAP